MLVLRIILFIWGWVKNLLSSSPKSSNIQEWDCSSKNTFWYWEMNCGIATLGTMDRLNQLLYVLSFIWKITNLKLTIVKISEGIYWISKLLMLLQYQVKIIVSILKSILIWQYRAIYICFCKLPFWFMMPASTQSSVATVRFAAAQQPYHPPARQADILEQHPS